MISEQQSPHMLDGEDLYILENVTLTIDGDALLDNHQDDGLSYIYIAGTLAGAYPVVFIFIEFKQIIMFKVGKCY